MDTEIDIEKIVLSSIITHCQVVDTVYGELGKHDKVSADDCDDLLCIIYRVVSHFPSSPYCHFAKLKK